MGGYTRGETGPSLCRTDRLRAINNGQHLAIRMPIRSNDRLGRSLARDPRRCYSAPQPPEQLPPFRLAPSGDSMISKHRDTRSPFLALRDASPISRPEVEWRGRSAARR